MNQETAPAAESVATPPRRKRLITTLRLLALAVPIAVVVTAAIVLPGWIPLLPRVVRRGMIETLLRAVLFGYTAMVLAAVVGTPVLIGWAAWGRPSGTARRRWMGGLSICVACLLAIVVLEPASAAWRGWMHRFPTLPTTFEEAPAGEYRILVLGGSSALGEPYRPWLSVGQIVAWQLQEAAPGRRVECEILAWLGESLEQQHHKLARIKHRPQAVIIYSGHNEFAARFEEERDPWVDEEPGNWLLQPVYRGTLLSPFCRLAYEIISKNRLDRPPPLTGRHQLIDPPLCSPSESADILADFTQRLESLVAYCERIGALPILIIPPANEAGFEPSRSTLPPTVPQAERRRVVEEFQTARAAESRDPARAAAGYAAILARHPGFAEAHFRLARLLERGGQWAEAGRHYLAALDNDGLPIRCPAPFRAAYQQVARRHPHCILIDGRRELAAISPNGLIGDRVIQDTHHPTLTGYVALAGAVLREMQLRNALDPCRMIELPLSPAACARHFSMDASKWATVYERTSVHFKRVAGYRFDPAERLEKSRRFAEAARVGSSDSGALAEDPESNTQP
ncbi:MAG TPA: hypothetical protein VFF52_18140 [Isosphaeraceae bacterium]|nr:hypothetical protein [Isosphaeraceae bacterium]